MVSLVFWSFFNDFLNRNIARKNMNWKRRVQQRNVLKGIKKKRVLIVVLVHVHCRFYIYFSYKSNEIYIYFYFCFSVVGFNNWFKGSLILLIFSVQLLLVFFINWFALLESFMLLIWGNANDQRFWLLFVSHLHF